MERKKESMWDWKLKESTLYIYFYYYKSKYSTTNIQFFLSKFQNFSPAHAQNNVQYKNCVQHKQKAKKKKKKKKRGGI